MTHAVFKIGYHIRRIAAYPVIWPRLGLCMLPAFRDLEARVGGQGKLARFLDIIGRPVYSWIEKAFNGCSIIEFLLYAWLLIPAV